MNTITALESTALESTALESTALESTALESTALESTATTLARANMTLRVSVANLETDYPDLKQVSVADVKKDSGKVTLSRIVLRAFVARALSGSNVDLSSKSLKGAFLTSAANSRLTDIIPNANEWKNLSRNEVLSALPELAALIHTAILGTTATKAVTSELDKARKYIANLSPETLTTLRKEGVI